MIDVSPVSPDERSSLRWPWGICWLLFAATAINYMDRQVITLVGPEIRKSFAIGNEGFGWVLAAFQLAYAFFQLPAGYLADRLDVRWIYAGAVAWWSLAGVSAAYSPTLGLLMASRAMLGVGEAFNWPCALRVTSAVLPPSDRSLGNGIFNSGAAVGAVLTPLAVTQLLQWFGWRPVFVLVGSLGLLWVIAWVVLLRGGDRSVFSGRSISRPSSGGWDTSPRPSMRLGARLLFGLVVVISLGLVALAGRYGARAIWWGAAVLMVGFPLMALVLPMRWLRGSAWAETLGEVVRLRRFWVLVVVSTSINLCWHFLVNWLPSYLRDERGMTLVAGGMLSAIPFLAADVGNLGGGWLSRRLAQRGIRPSMARFRVMAGCSILITAGAWVGRVNSDVWALLLLATMALGTAAFMANYFACTQEVSARHTGFIVGILGGLANLFVAGFLPFAGYLKDRTGSFGALFLMVGFLPILGAGVLGLGWGEATMEEGSG